MKSSCLRAWLTAGALAFAACGPNYRYVYDGESAFERCYAFDYDPNVPVSSRASCWTSWLQSYQFGASADRVEYARGRAANPGAVPGLSAPPPANGIATPTPSAASPAPTPAPKPAPPVAALVAPQSPVAATNPAVVGRAATTATPGSGTNDTWQRAQISGGGNPVAAPPPTSTQSATGSEPPGAACAADCRNAWSASAAQCVSRDAACTARSDETYRDCMRGCF